MTFFKSLAYFVVTLSLCVNSASLLQAQSKTINNSDQSSTIYHFPPPMDDISFPFKTVTIDANTPQWAKMLYEVNPNITEVRKLHWQWRKNNPDVKNGHTRNFKKLSGYLAENGYVNDAGYMEFPTSEELKAENKHIIAEHKKAKQNQSNSRSNNNTTWQLIGPTYKKTTSNNLVNRQINIYSLTQSLSNTDILYCVSESGGTVFKTTDHGDSWFSVSDRDVTSRLSAIAVNTAGAVSTELHYGLNLKWVPVYGKYAYFNQKISQTPQRTNFHQFIWSSRKWAE